MSVFLLKIIAVICMFCDHIRYVFPNTNTETMRALGRIAFPIFAFLITEGYVHTKNLKKYIIRLGIFALLSEIPFLLFTIGCKIYDKIELNVIFTLFCGILSLIFYDKAKTTFLNLVRKNCSENNVIKRMLFLASYVISIAILVLLAQNLHMDYGAWGVGIILIFYILREKKILKNLLVASIFIIGLFLKCKNDLNSINYCIPYFAGYICSAAILMNYNEKVGKYKMKYFFYLFYPIHMVVLYLMYISVH